MFRRIKDFIFAVRFKRTVKKADYFRHITHRKYMVIVVNGKLEVISKQEIRKFVSHGIFQKGTTAGDIESKALYITM